MRYGGPIYTVHGLCRALAERGHEVHVFTTNVDGRGISDVPTDKAVELDGVSVRYFPAGPGRRIFRSPVMGRALQKRCRTFDLVHLHSVFLWPTMAAGKVARRWGIPYVMTPRGMLVADLIERKSRLAKRTWISLFERRNIERAAAVHFTSQIEADQMRSLGLRTRRSAVIGNGVDAAEAACAPSADDLEWLQALRQPFVLYLGRVSWKKGLDRLLCAMRRLERATLVVAGNDEDGYQRVLAAIAERHGIAQRVQFIGPVTGTRKWALLRHARMLVLPSYSENFGMVVLEAMAAGCPVVVTSEVGLAEIVNASGAGLVVNGEPDQLAEAMARLDNDANARKTMGDAGRRAAAERFSWTRIAAEMDELYAQCAPADRSA